MLFFKFADFYFVLVLALISSSLLLLATDNSVHSVLYLVLCFFTGASILLSFNIEFLGLAFIIIYVGAIAVLFLFVVMMLNVKKNSAAITLNDFLVPGELFFFFFLLTEKTLLPLDYELTNFFAFFDDLHNIILLGQLLFNYFLLYILFAGFILLVAIIGPVTLTFDFDKKEENVLVRQLARRFYLTTKKFKQSHL